MTEINLSYRKEQEIIFREIIRNFLLTVPVDVLAFLIITIIVGIPLFFLIPKYNFYFIALLYSSVLVVCYLLYSFLMKPFILRNRYSRWFYYKESPHDTPEKMIEQLKNRINFMKSANKYLLMRMGELNSKLWNNGIYIDTIKELIERGVDIEIAIKKTCDVEIKELLKLAVEEKIKLYMMDDEAIEKISRGHFILTDKKGLWIIEPHLPFVQDKRGRYSFGPTYLADEKEKIFNEVKTPAGILVNKKSITDLNFIIHGADRRPRQANDCERENLFKYLEIEN